MNQLLILLSKLIYALQKERGSLCLCLSVKNKDSFDKLTTCFRNSDQLITNILKFDTNNNKINSDQLKSYNKLENIFNGFSAKTPFRHNVNKTNELESCDINILDVIPLYTHSIIIHLTYVLTELALFDKNNIPSEISALSNFVNWKERTSRERALGVIGFTINNLDADQFSKDFDILLSEQTLNERSFLALATMRQKNVFELYTKDTNFESSHWKMEFSKKADINSLNWFKLITEKVKIMHQIEIDLIKHFDSEPSNAYQSLMDDKELSLILDFPFFRGLSEETIHQLFKPSKIKKYKKGSMLFFEGEPASKIYVILSGWVKIFKNAQNGDETVEQMLSTGSLVIESSIFSNDKYFSNAQISNKAKLMSFPSSNYRKLLDEDLALALNSLKYLSLTSKSYLNQIDNNRLKTSKERVGWFLLKQFIQQKNPNTILLPYEKTIIASLLDMKPETFSRSLKSFKSNGLSTEKHQVQIEDFEVLCHYCDSDLSTHCNFKDKYDCKFKHSEK